MIEPFLSAISGYLHASDVRTAFDVGSRDALQALELATAFPRSSVHAFECNPQTIPLCLENAVCEPRVLIVPSAVHENNGTCIFYPIDPSKTQTSWPDGNPGASSLFLANGTYPIEHFVQHRVEVPAVRLDTYCEQAKIEAVDLIWMDLQGAELMALRSLGTYISHLDFLWTEVTHRAIYAGQCLFNEVHEFLVGKGFTLVREPEMGGWQGDAVYISSRRALLDVVIPCDEKDVSTLEACIQGVRTHVPEVRNVFVVSKRRLSDHADWLPEDRYPFSLADVERVLPQAGSRAGWYLQQLLKLYAPFVLPDPTHRVLVVDADTIFQRRCQMLGNDGRPLYAVGTEYHEPYFAHMHRLLPGLHRVGPSSGIVHHMVLDHTVLGMLFREVESLHARPFWQAFLEQVAPSAAPASGASEYEIYFNYWQWRDPECGRFRPLAWANVTNAASTYDLDFAAAHSYMRA
jgi:FkbM family methyltransferase